MVRLMGPPHPLKLTDQHPETDPHCADPDPKLPAAAADPKLEPRTYACIGF